jgi:serine protease Do
MTRIEAVAKVKDAVVEITTTTVSSYGQLVAGAGSGVIIHADGIIVTNHHVIDGASTIYVRLTNGNTYEAYLRGSDEKNDIAVLKITPQETLTVAKLGYSSALALGEDVFAIGNPLGSLGGTMTDGTISALEREVQVGGVTMTLLQTNAAINSGNSGGGLFNMAGELIGVVNAKYSASGVEGLGFAIPIDTAYTSICLLLEKGYIPGIPTMGVSIEVRLVGNWVNYRQELYVYEETADTPFETGDCIYYVAGIAVSGVEEIDQIVRRHEVGDTIDVIVKRNGQQMTLSVTLIEYIPS